jgi:hypothetical protein
MPSKLNQTSSSSRPYYFEYPQLLILLVTLTAVLSNVQTCFCDEARRSA